MKDQNGKKEDAKAYVQRMADYMVETSKPISAENENGEPRGFFSTLWEHNKKFLTTLLYATPAIVGLVVANEGRKRAVKAIAPTKVGKVLRLRKIA